MSIRFQLRTLLHFFWCAWAQFLSYSKKFHGIDQYFKEKSEHKSVKVEKLLEKNCINMDDSSYGDATDLVGGT